MHRLVASFFGIGLLPRRLWDSDAGAGTLGGLAAAAIAWIADLPLALDLVVIAGAIVLSLWASAPFAAGGEDPGWIVIDEVAGTFVAVAGLTGWPFLVGFVVFRIADIFKATPGVGSAERLPGAAGITADDVVAGLYGLAAGLLVAWIV
jgi:phosphatidylglycerophosphatase A